MVETIMIWALKQFGAQIGKAAYEALKEAIFGKSIKIEDLKNLLDSLAKALKLLPEETVEKIRELKYKTTIDLAKKNLKSSNYEGLCKFLDINEQERSYWMISEELSRTMIDISLDQLLEIKSKDDKNFVESGLLWNRSMALLGKNEKGKYTRMRDWAFATAGDGLTVTVAIITINAIAKESKAKISKCPKGHAEYDRCQKILKNTDINKYFPDDEKELDFAAMLTPKIEFAIQHAMGGSRSTEFLKVVNGKGWRLFKSIYRDNKTMSYLAKDETQNPWLKKGINTPYKITFNSSDTKYIRIMAGYKNTCHEELYLYIELKGAIFATASQAIIHNKLADWGWYVYKDDKYGIVEIFINHPNHKEGYHYALSSSKFRKRSYADNGSENDSYAFYQTIKEEYKLIYPWKNW